MVPKRSKSKSLSITAHVLSLLLSLLWSTHTVQLADAKIALPKRPALLFRGGSTRVLETEPDLNPDGGKASQGQPDTSNSDDDSNDKGISPQELKRRKSYHKYHIEQQMLMQLRSNMLSEALAKRGLPMITIVDVCTADGDKPPETVDWDCAMSTPDELKSCLYSFDAEPNTKVIAPLGTTQWISLSALNRLRRTDPTKVEPMWHSKYAIDKCWFGDDSPYSILQHCGPTGLILSLLLDNGIILKSLLTVTIFLVILLFFPLMDSSVNRILVSSTVWGNWSSWARFVHAALPLKLLLVQLGFKGLAGLATKMEQRIKTVLVELECINLESCVPLTVGPGSDVVEVGVEIDDDVDDDEDDGGDIVLDEDCEQYTKMMMDEDVVEDFVLMDEDDDYVLDELIDGLVGDVIDGEED